MIILELNKTALLIDIHTRGTVNKSLKRMQYKTNKRTNQNLNKFSTWAKYFDRNFKKQI